jgi:AcrR family transcriptional regulator
MPPSAVGTYRGVSAQQRRAERRRRLLDAAFEIIGTSGWSAATLRGICERAKVGPRFFYESFADVDELAAALHDELLASALRRTLDSLAAAPNDLRARTEAAFRTMIIELTDDPRTAKVLFSEAYGSATLMQRRFAAMRTLSDAMLEQAQLTPELPERGERVLRAVSLLVTGGVTEFVLGWLNSGLDLNRDELVAISVEFALTVGDAVAGMAERLTSAGRA